MKKIKNIVLIDDNEATNYIHKHTIEKNNIAEHIIIFQKATKALEYLKNIIINDLTKPDLILLDINMPSMNGWEFLEEYKKLNVTNQASSLIIMLSTSLNPDDEERAKNIKEVRGFVSKPLSEEQLFKVLNN